MPLRSAPLPRMAGHLSFMRAQTKTIDEIKPGDLAVLGLPFEDTSAPYSGQSMAPRALRETSVYFGWHANPQFSHPVDIDARQDISTEGLHAKLGDLGDIALGSEDQVHVSLGEATRHIFHAEACAILLGGSDQMSKTVQKELPNCQVVQLGGAVKDESCFHLASLTSGAFSSPGGDASLAEFTRWRDESKPLFVHFDLSVFRSPLSALCDHPRLGGCDLETVSRWLGTFGNHRVSAIMLTGLNPSRPGMGVVKVGQRLMVTALLTFIYAQLGFYAANVKQVTAKENDLT